MKNQGGPRAPQRDEKQSADCRPPIEPQNASIVFLGTASMCPSPTRNVSGNALRIGKEWTVVDCGEGTQHQIIRCPVRISPAAITRIFITHLHGDHCFGLPGLMCLINNAVSNVEDDEQRPILHIVGPKGLRNMTRAALSSSLTALSYKYRVDELCQHNDEEESGPMPLKRSGTSTSNHLCHFSTVFEVPPHPSELAGETVHPQEDGSWIIPRHPKEGIVDSSWTIRAAPLVHTTTCVGFVFHEHPLRGKLDAITLKRRLLTKENCEYLSAHGIRNPLQLLGKLQNGQSVDIMESTGSITTLDPKDYMTPPTPGRKIVILGDTCDSRRLAHLAANADVMVHEATNAAVEDFEEEEAVLATAIARGHSTPAMAGAFAKCCGVKMLILTHFSSRYKGDDDESEESREVMAKIKDEASSNLGHSNVVAARDMMEIIVPTARGRRLCGQSVLPDDAEVAAAAKADAFLERVGLR